MKRVLNKWKVLVVVGVVLAVVGGLVAGPAWSSGHAPKRSSATVSAAKSKQVVRVFGMGVQTDPALGALFPTFTVATTEPNVVLKSVNASAASKVKLEYSFCDTQGTPTGSVTCARQAASPTACGGKPCDVALEVGDPSDNLSLPVLATEGIPTVETSTSTTQAADAADNFCITSGAPAIYSGLGYVIKKAGAHKVGIMGVDRPDAQADQNLMISGATRVGLTVAGQQIIPQTTVSPNATIDSVMTGGADGLIDAVVGPVGSAFQYAEQTYPGAALAMPLFAVGSSFFSGVPSSVLEGVGVTAWSEPSSATTIPGIKMWRAEGGLAATTSAWTHHDFSVLIWLGMHFVANVANTISGSITPASMLHAFKTAKNVNMYGIVPPWSASAMGKNGALPCSPYNIFVADTLHNDGIQYADNPGVFINAQTDKVAYVDPGFKKP